MTAKNRVLRLFKALALCLLFVPTSVLAQNNLLPTGVSNFNIGVVGNGDESNNLSNVGVTTNYTYKTDENSLQSNETGPRCYAVGDNARWYNHQTNIVGIEQGYFAMGDHTTGGGNYMVVNGAPTSNVKVWEYTVDVVPGVRYEFKAWTTCLFIRIATLPPLSSCPRLQLKINDTPVGDEFTVPWVNGGEWTLWSREWTAGNNTTSAKITIIDNCTDRDGNDFGLDDIVFKMVDGYSLTAIDDTVTYCGEITPIELIQNVHYTMDYPSGGNSAPPMQVRIRKNNNDPWATSITTFHGTAYVGNDNKIYYTPNSGFHGTDYVRFQVSRFGLADAGLITIRVYDLPSNCTPQGMPADGKMCLDAVSSFAPTASWTNNGSIISSADWEFKKDGVTDWEPGNDFQSYVQNQGGTGEYSIRFYAINECGSATSNEFQIVVIDKPSVESLGEVSVCAPATFSSNAPSVDYHGSDPVASPCWQIQINGQWENVPNTIEYEHNGCNIRYYAENGCGPGYSDTVQLIANAAPIVGPIVAPMGICENDTLVLDTPQIIWRHNDQSSCSGGWEIQINGVWTPLVNQNIPFEYNGCLIRYKAVNGCDTTYSTNNAQITVYSTAPVNEGEVTACDPIYYHGHYCDTTGLYIVNDTTPNGCAIQVLWHFTLGEAYIAPVQFVDTCDYYYWPKTQHTYYESNVYDTIIYSDDPQVCDSTFTLDLTIHHAPSIQGEIQMNDICVGDLLTVVEPEFDEGRSQWEFASSPNGPFQAFDPETYQLEYGNHYIRFVVINECDSTFSNMVTMHVNDSPVITGMLEPLQVCEGNALDLPEVSVDWRNASQNGDSRWQMAEYLEGPYAQFDSIMPMQTEFNGHWVRYMAHNECDTVYLGPVQVTVIDDHDVTVEHEPECDSVLFSGVYYVIDTIIDEFVEEPCPYTIHHEIIVNHSDYKEIERTTCQEFFDWHGHHFEHSDETQYATFDTVNRYGCDSTVVLKLDFGPYEKINLDDVIACDSYVWDMKPEVVYYESQRDSVFVPASSPDDCPTWFCLNMTIGTSYNEVEGDAMIECYGFEWHGVPYYEDGVVYDSLLTKITHCDSIVFHQLTIVQPMDTVVDMVSCEPYLWHTHLFSEDETFTDTLQSVVTGCDSIVTINFRLDDIVKVIDTVACEPFEWYGYVCDSSHTDMTIQHVFQSSMGCDSTVVKHVRLEQAAVQEKPRHACTPYLCSINGVLYEEPGVFYIDSAVVSSQYGCDSIVYTIRLEVKDSEQIGLINGSSNVFVASSLISGIYRYEIDPDEVIGDITWSLSNPDWHIVEAERNYCLVFVTTPGLVTLSARFMTAECDVIERSFEINAGFYGLGDEEAITANVYPNPTDGMVTIEAEGIEHIRLTDMMGQVLKIWEGNGLNSAVLNLNGYKPSVYLVEIKTVYGVVNRRLVLCR